LGQGSCLTKECGSGQAECNRAGAAPLATLAEFTYGSESGTQDFYDVSLVNGYNIQMIVEASGGSGDCATTVTLEYSYKGAFDSPAACQPTAYSQLFKTVCPKSYSYAYGDATSTFMCMGADEYTVVFCPSLAR
ncbi:thaumatin-like protein 1, partial [Tanacetum coccineum]